MKIELFVSKLFAVAVLTVIQAGASAYAQGKKSLSVAELAAYTGPDREQRLLLLGPEGAKILGHLEYGSPLKPVSFKHWYPEAGMSMVQYDKAMERWDKMLPKIGRK